MIRLECSTRVADIWGSPASDGVFGGAAVSGTANHFLEGAMTVMNIYYPTETDATLLAWIKATNARLATHAELYPITTQQVGNLASAGAQFEMTMDKIADPQFRSPPFVAAKRAAAENLRRIAGPIVSQLRRDVSLSDQLKLDLGIKPIDKTPTPAPTPSESPVLSLKAASSTEIGFTAASQSDETRRAKPAGVKSIAVATFVGDEPPTSMDQWNQAMLFGRTRGTITMSGIIEPTKVWVTAWYVNTRNVTGPASVPTSVRLLGTGSPVPNQEQTSGEEPMKIAA
ncbi:MAG: hypothetical protein AAGI46_01555 [Planctomycetota bacterium]